MAQETLFTNREMVSWQLLAHGLGEIYISFSVQKPGPSLLDSNLRTGGWWRHRLIEPFPHTVILGGRGSGGGGGVRTIPRL